MEVWEEWSQSWDLAHSKVRTRETDTFHYNPNKELSSLIGKNLLSILKLASLDKALLSYWVVYTVGVSGAEIICCPPLILS